MAVVAPVNYVCMYALLGNGVKDNGLAGLSRAPPLLSIVQGSFKAIPEPVYAGGSDLQASSTAGSFAGKLETPCWTMPGLADTIRWTLILKAGQLSNPTGNQFASPLKGNPMDEEVEAKSQRHPNRRGLSLPFEHVTSTWILPATFLLLITTTLLLWNTVKQREENLNPASRVALATPRYGCGSSPQEAINLGCNFDLLAIAWLPSQCQDPLTAAEYQRWVHQPNRKPAPFPYYKDIHARRQFANEDELSRYEELIYTSREEHLGHCLMLPLRNYRMLTQEAFPRRMDTQVNSFNHTAHCFHMLEEAVKGDGANMGLIDTAFGLQYGKC